jgi:hypothetical protein
MKDDLATEQDWVPFHEAARRLAGVDGERLLLPGQVVFTNSSRKLSEAGKNGRLSSRGILARHAVHPTLAGQKAGVPRLI